MSPRRGNWVTLQHQTGWNPSDRELYFSDWVHWEDSMRLGIGLLHFVKLTSCFGMRASLSTSEFQRPQHAEAARAAPFSMHNERLNS